MGAGRIARPPFLPGGIGRLHVDEFAPKPDPAQSQVRIEPDVSLNELFEPVLCIFQQIQFWRPVNRELGPDLDCRCRRGVDELGLIADVIDTKLDLMLDAASFDDRHSSRVGIAADLAIEHIAHGENGLQRIALRAAGRRDIRLTAGDPDHIIEDRLDGLGVDTARIVLDDDRSRIDDDRDVGRDLGLLAGIERVVHDLLAHDQRPIIDRVPGLILQLTFAAELHQPRDLEGYTGELRLRPLASGPLGLCHNL